MNIYHIWCDLKPGVSDRRFAEAIDRYLGHLQESDRLSDFRLTRRKLGLASAELGEFHITLEFQDLAQLDLAFDEVSTRREPVESLHQAVNSLATNLRFALYRDFPDPNRVAGEEKF